MIFLSVIYVDMCSPEDNFEAITLRILFDRLSGDDQDIGLICYQPKQTLLLAAASDLALRRIRSGTRPLWYDAEDMSLSTTG